MGAGRGIERIDPFSETYQALAAKRPRAHYEARYRQIFETFPETFQALLDMIGAFHGITMTGDDVTALGKSILKMEREFNLRAGLSKEHDRLPRFFLKEPIPPHNVTFEVADEDLDKVFDW